MVKKPVFWFFLLFSFFTFHVATLLPAHGQRVILKGQKGNLRLTPVYVPMPGTLGHKGTGTINFANLPEASQYVVNWGVLYSPESTKVNGFVGDGDRVSILKSYQKDAMSERFLLIQAFPNIQGWILADGVDED